MVYNRLSEDCQLNEEVLEIIRYHLLDIQNLLGGFHTLVGEGLGGGEQGGRMVATGTPE